MINVKKIFVLWKIRQKNVNYRKFQLTLRNRYNMDEKAIKPRKIQPTFLIGVRGYLCHKKLFTHGEQPVLRLQYIVLQKIILMKQDVRPGWFRTGGGTIAMGILPSYFNVGKSQDITSKTTEHTNVS